jgi:putative transposase
MQVKQAAKKSKSTHSLVYGCQYHVIFCPKYRCKILTNDVTIRLRELIGERQKEYGYQVLEIMCDQVHLLLDVNPQIGIEKIVGKIKEYTANALRKGFPVLKSHLASVWTRSQFISSIGAVTLEIVKCIEEQKGV